MRISNDVIKSLKLKHVEANELAEYKNDDKKLTKEEIGDLKFKKITLSISDALKFLEEGTSVTNENKTEKFDDVRAEMAKNVPDSTSTIEEKELALSYIDRLLACDDITPELKNYWSNKKDIIEMEIQTIKNEQQTGNNESINDVAKEWREFTAMYWNKTPEFENTADRVEYYRSYYNMYISFCDRALACDDISEEERTEWTRMKQNAISDLNYHNRDLNRYNAKNGQTTEKFENVFAEMKANVPDSTSTIDEKNLALSYIERMLSCDDIPNPQYWENKKSVIEMEIQSIKNEQQAGSGEKIEDVWKEFSEFTNKYFGSLNDNMSMEEKYENRVAYYNMYKSFINRFMGCTDITEEQRAEYMRMDTNADIDLFNWQQDYERYKNEQ